MSIITLKKRKEFVALNERASRYSRPAFVLQGLKRESDLEAMRLGFTVTKKVGKAVVRNRIKRRLKAAAAQVVPRSGAPGTDYVFIGRDKALTCPFSELLQDMQMALEQLSRNRGAAPRPPRKK